MSGELSICRRLGHEIVGDEPFIPVGVSKEFRARHEEHSPSLHPAMRIGVDVFEDFRDGRARGIELCQPRVERRGVVTAADAPMIDDAKVIVEVPEKIF